MPIYRYQAQDEAGAGRRGLLRAPDEVAAGAAVAQAGLRHGRVRRYRGWPPWPFLAVVPLLVVVLLATIAQLCLLGARKQGWYRQLAREGVTTTGKLAMLPVPPRHSPGGADDWPFAFTTPAGDVTGWIRAQRTLSLTPGEVSFAEFGAKPLAGMEVTVTYVPNRPQVCVPFAMTAERLWFPVRQVAGTLAALLLLLAIVVVAVRAGLRQAWPERALTRDAATWADGDLRELPTAGIEPAGKAPAAPLPAGPWPGAAMLGVCAAGYLAAGTLGWWLALGSEVTAGRLFAGLQMAVGLGLLVVPVVSVCLAMRVSRPLTLVTGLAAMLAHGGWLWHQAAGDQGVALVRDMLRRHPLGMVAGWLLPLAAMVALAHWPWLLARLGRPKPMWREEGE
jgi:hypothetical protein